MEEYMLPCLNKRLFGFDCPGCGTQRALMLLFRGDWVGAFHMFPAIYTLILLCACLALHVIDKSRNYQKAIGSLAVLNALIILVAYYYKLTHY